MSRNYLSKTKTKQKNYSEGEPHVSEDDRFAIVGGGHLCGHVVVEPDLAEVLEHRPVQFQRVAAAQTVVSLAVSVYVWG